MRGKTILLRVGNTRGKMPETKTAQHTANYSRLSRTVHNLYMKNGVFLIFNNVQRIDRKNQGSHS